MRNKKTAVALIVTVAAFITTCVSLKVHRISNTNDKENRVLSVLHATVENGIVEEIDNVQDQIDLYTSNLYTNSVYDSAEIDKGQFVKFAKGSVVIVTKGRMSAVCEKELIDITEGVSLTKGEETNNNHLYVIIEDGDGLYAEGKAEFFAKGGYEITESIKE